jgi:hypothetical protein
MLSLPPVSARRGAGRKSARDVRRIPPAIPDPPAIQKDLTQPRNIIALSLYTITITGHSAMFGTE